MRTKSQDRGEQLVWQTVPCRAGHRTTAGHPTTGNALHPTETGAAEDRGDFFFSLC